MSDSGGRAGTGRSRPRRRAGPGRWIARGLVSRDGRRPGECTHTETQMSDSDECDSDVCDSDECRMGAPWPSPRRMRPATSLAGLAERLG